MVAGVLPTGTYRHMKKATAVAGSNIAFVKYWGNLDDEQRIPMNGSISMTLDAAHTITTVEFRDDYDADRLTLNEELATQKATYRAAVHLDHLRAVTGNRQFAKVVSQNSFPTGAGIASSASGFAALTMAASAALGLNLSNKELSRLARLGSGSASRSIDGGFVEWMQGGTHESSYAQPLAPADHWDLVDVIAIVSQEEKHVGSTAGHPLAHTSPFYQARLGALQTVLPAMRRAIMERDFDRFGELLEAEAISLHVAAMTSVPSILYWGSGTMTILHALRLWREMPNGPVGYFTLDAGPNVHILTLPEHVPALLEQLRKIDAVHDSLVCKAGPAAHIIDKHLF